MPKLVVLSAGFEGRAHDLTTEKTTIGRVEDNAFQIAEPSVSSHHAEVLLRGNEVVVRDLGSTNGTYINGEKITEAVLKPGQTLRLGQVELRLDTGTGAPSAPAASAAPSAPAPAPARKLEHTMVIQRGVSLDELEQGPRTGGFDTTSKAFSKKTNQTNRWFLIGGIILFSLIIIVLLVALLQTGN
ncbi:MAG TPA: FHA domain-containing protein [Verrucomicrobia bacterium]|nr:FHA domain-containing protein [Verrucomicrobiota bacterium]HOP98582.1 FHA domain-containing protein [Verrucomicrobiota bacterium]